ncbi:hypothetical protein BU15DRAFT_59232 [Melanogaster broomeanus]|nr:hypothetical protein BU15DRAFT_59232 [Melanogaster broomeanus]
MQERNRLVTNHPNGWFPSVPYKTPSSQQPRPHHWTVAKVVDKPPVQSSEPTARKRERSRGSGVGYRPITRRTDARDTIIQDDEFNGFVNEARGKGSCNYQIFRQEMWHRIPISVCSHYTLSIRAEKQEQHAYWREVGNAFAICQGSNCWVFFGAVDVEVLELSAIDQVGGKVALVSSHERIYDDWIMRGETVSVWVKLVKKGSNEERTEN